MSCDVSPVAMFFVCNLNIHLACFTSWAQFFAVCQQLMRRSPILVDAHLLKRQDWIVTVSGFVRVKRVVPQLFFFCCYLIFWKVIGCDLARFGWRNLWTPVLEKIWRRLSGSTDNCIIWETHQSPGWMEPQCWHGCLSLRDTTADPFKTRSKAWWLLPWVILATAWGRWRCKRWGSGGTTAQDDPRKLML